MITVGLHMCGAPREFRRWRRKAVCGVVAIAALLVLIVGHAGFAAPDDATLPEWMSKQIQWPAEEDMLKHRCDAPEYRRSDCVGWLRRLFADDILPKDIDAHLVAMRAWGVIGDRDYSAERNELCDVFLLRIDKLDVGQIYVQESAWDVVVAVRFRDGAPAKDPKQYIFDTANRILAKRIRPGQDEQYHFVANPFPDSPNITRVRWIAPEAVGGDWLMKDGKRIAVPTDHAKAAEIGTSGVAGYTNGRVVRFYIQKVLSGGPGVDPHAPRFAPPQASLKAAQVSPEAFKQMLMDVDAIKEGDATATATVERAFKVLPQAGGPGNIRNQLIIAGVNALVRAGTPEARQYLDQVVDAHRFPDDTVLVIKSLSKALPKAQSADYCLTKLKEIAEKPDGMPERTIALMHCLPGSLSSDQTNTLMMVTGMARTPEIREVGYVILTRALVDSEEGRTDVTRILRERLADPEPRIRATAARGLGATGDVRCVRNLVALLDDPAYEVRQSAVRAICRLLNWKAPELREGADKPVIADVTARLAPVLKALEVLDAAAKQPALR